MIIFPAIDLLDGKCVRLKQGDFGQATTYSSEPKELLQKFEASGFNKIHIVDLSGARDPEQRQLSLIRELVSSTSIKIQLGGGIRSLREVSALLEMGVERVVLGSIAVSQPETTLDILKEFGPERITLALDVFPDTDSGTVFRIATQGWQKKETTKLEEILTFYQETGRGVGISRVLCTDISRDGMMQGPNLDLYRFLVSTFPKIEFQASGGVASTSDFRSLETVGVHSVVVGKAMYENAIGVLEMLGDANAQ